MPPYIYIVIDQVTLVPFLNARVLELSIELTDRRRCAAVTPTTETERTRTLTRAPRPKLPADEKTNRRGSKRFLLAQVKNCQTKDSKLLRTQKSY